MWLRVTIDRQLVVHAIEAAMDAHPLQDCPQARPACRGMVGAATARGWRQAIAQHMGGVASCTHLRELLFNMATLCLPDLARRLWWRRPGHPPRHLGQCTGWDFEGNGVKEYFPKFYGRGEANTQPSTHTTPQGKRASWRLSIKRNQLSKQSKHKGRQPCAQNKSIIVTGAGNGIGEGIAKRLAQEGAQVLVNDINTTGGQRVVAEITALQAARQRSSRRT